MRRDLRAVLDAFVASHRGLRSGHVFGVPAAFAGRRVFAKLDRDGLRVRLPQSSDPSSAPPARRAALPARSAGPSGRRPVPPARGGGLLASSVLPRVSARPSPGPPLVRPPGRRPASADWVVITPSSPSAQRLEMLLEQAVRHVALA